MTPSDPDTPDAGVVEPAVAARTTVLEEGDMAFAIEVAGTLQRTVRHRLVELVGDDAVDERAGHIVVSATDQSAMIGILHRLNDLGLDIARIERV